MKRIWWIVGSALLIFVVAPVGFIAWILSDLGDVLPDVPFSSTYPLPSGEKVVVSGTSSGDFQVDTSTSYKITLHFPDGKREIVTEGTVINEENPDGPFVLSKTPTRLFLASDHEIYSRPLTKGGWGTWSYKDDPILPFLGRALMPSSYARTSPCNSEWNDGCLPAIPAYKFERWKLAKQLVVVRQGGTDWPGSAEPSLWPRRLVFRAEKLDVASTLTLEPRFKLRPLPKGVRVELLKMSLPNKNDGWDEKNEDMSYNKAQKARGARVLGREAWSLSTRFYNSPLPSWWSAKGKTTFQMRGLCSDPNSQMLLFGWKIAGISEWWTIAHNGQWRNVRDADYGLQSPYLFVRFSWPVRQTHTRSQK